MARKEASGLEKRSREVWRKGEETLKRRREEGM